MQDGENSTPEGAEESDSIKPGQDSELAFAASSEETDPKKVYDYYHQHFGVALAAGSQEIRDAEASNRAAYAARSEVADKQSPKSESWNALKSLIRYQTSTTVADRPSDTISGDSFEAQWFSKSTEDVRESLIHGDAATEPAPVEEADAVDEACAVDESNAVDSIEHQEPDGVRLKWTPIVDNVPDRPRQSEETVEQPQNELDDLSYEEALAAVARGEAATINLAQATTDDAESEANSIAISNDVPKEESLANSNERPTAPRKKFVGVPARIARRPVLRPQSAPDASYEEALAATARGEKANTNAKDDIGETTLKLVRETPAPQETPHQEVEPQEIELQEIDHKEKINHQDTKSDTIPDSIADEIDDLLEAPATPVERDEEANEHNAAEARSKFGSMNAFAKLQQRTKEQVETKEEQSITGDIPEEVQAEVQSGNWDTKPNSADAKPEGATVINQWCSTSTGDSTPAISLADLDNIPTPNVMKEAAPQPKPFSLSAPKAPDAGDITRPTPEAVHQAARSSWLKAASEYSSSVIKAVTEQMKMLNSKPKKVTPESPEFKAAELPNSADDNSQM